MAKLNTNIYNRFASDYDSFMIPMPYGQWVNYTCKLINKHKTLKERKILDIACGTGNFLFKMAKKGYSIHGLDASAKMLSQARSKAKANRIKARFTKNRMESLKVNEKFPVITCLFDSVNYLTDANYLSLFFQNVCSFLKNKGIFIFDMNTVYGLKNGWGNRVHINKNKNLLAVCTHKYYKEAKLASIELCIFSKIAKNTYKNYVETHTERGYEINIIKNKLKKAGFTKIRTYADRTLKKPGNKTARIWFCAVK